MPPLVEKVLARRAWAYTLDTPPFFFRTTPANISVMSQSAKNLSDLDAFHPQAD